MTNLSSLLRVALGLLVVALGVIVFMVVCTLLLPWRSARIRACNVFGHIVGRAILVGMERAVRDMAELGREARRAALLERK